MINDTADSVLGTFTKGVERLKKIQEKNNLKKAVNEDTIHTLQQKNEKLQTETDRATRVSAKIQELIS